MRLNSKQVQVIKASVKAVFGPDEPVKNATSKPKTLSAADEARR